MNFYIITISVISQNYSSMSLTGKVCLVTGASRGIGRGIALALGSEGATVYITGRTLDPVSTVPGSLTVTADEVSTMLICYLPRATECFKTPVLKFHIL